MPKRHQLHNITKIAKVLTILGSDGYTWFPAPSKKEGAGNQAQAVECRRVNHCPRDHKLCEIIQPDPDQMLSNSMSDLDACCLTFDQGIH